MLNNKDFVAYMDAVMNEKHHITDDDIYRAIKYVYYPKWLANEKSVDAGLMQSALRQYTRHIYGDAHIWRNEFIALSESGATEY